MDFLSRISRSPRPFDAQRGAEGRALFPQAPPELGEVLEGAAGSSPYLAGLMLRHRDWLATALAGAPEAAIAQELADLPEGDADALGPALRRAKGRVALLVGLADLAGVWPLETVTGALTDFADRACDTAMKALVAAEIRRGKLPGLTPADADTAGGMFALAMGKMGARELNYSSDIDLICLFDETRFETDDYTEARQGFVRITRWLAALLSDLTADGYVFRTDLRLRPDPSVTPVCLSTAAAESYYESVGRTWERAAHIKARPCAGDLAAGEAYLERLRPFVWRKHLDFAAIQDAHDMRLRIRDHRGLHGPITLPGHNMKLGPGGIREIEFYTQTRQLISGGRDPELRQRGTVAGLAALAAKGWVEPHLAESLTADYRAHREIEHRLQIIADAQTHELPTTPEGFDRLAALAGRSTAELKADLLTRLTRVASQTEGFFAPGPASGQPMPELSDNARQIVAGWRGYPALRSPRAVEIFDRVRPELLARLVRAARPEEALTHLDAFLQGLPAGVQIFSLFEANPTLIDLIIDIAATAPALAAYLGRNAAVLDAVIGGSFFAPWPGETDLRADLAATLQRARGQGADYEKRLDAARVWLKEWHFRVGVHHLRALVTAAEAGRAYADLAGAVLATLWPEVTEEFARKHGPPPGRGAAVIGMGSLGAGWLTAGSDLDLIVIYDPADAEASSGPRPLAVRPYYARLTQALVTALAAPMAEGRLYEVDMRLRPSGRQGPVATSVIAFEAYQHEEAWTWESLALTRARAVAGSAEVSARFEKFRRGLLASPRDRDKVLADVAEMRARIAGARGSGSVWDVKAGPGGVQDIELIGQTAALLAGDPARETISQIGAGVSAGLWSAADARVLAESYRLQQAFRGAARLLADRPAAPDELGAGATEMLLRETGLGLAGELAPALTDAAARADGIVARVLAGYDGPARVGQEEQDDT